MNGDFLICFSVAPARIGALMCSAMYGMEWVFKESFGVVVSMNIRFLKYLKVSIFWNGGPIKEVPYQNMSKDIMF